MSRMKDRPGLNSVEPAQQVAALPLRWGDDARPLVLMVTSRDTGRWVMPKGWAEEGMTLSEAAACEALEEAGAVGPISPREIGAYRYRKGCGNGAFIECRVNLFPMLVQELQEGWKERAERTRRWFTFAEAADTVDESDLAEILLRLQTAAVREPTIRDLLRDADIQVSQTGRIK